MINLPASRRQIAPHRGSTIDSRFRLTQLASCDLARSNGSSSGLLFLAQGMLFAQRLSVFANVVRQPVRLLLARSGPQRCAPYRRIMT